MLRIKFKGPTHTAIWKYVCAAIFKSFIKRYLSFCSNFPLAGINSTRNLDNLNSVLAQTGFRQSVGLNA